MIGSGGATGLGTGGTGGYIRGVTSVPANVSTIKVVVGATGTTSLVPSGASYITVPTAGPLSVMAGAGGSGATGFGIGTGGAGGGGTFTSGVANGGDSSAIGAFTGKGGTTVGGTPAGQSCVGGFAGAVGSNPSVIFEEAFGGILFIDEAYNLVGRGQQDFGIEAVDTLLKMMEDYRGKFIVIVAGYEELMMQFLASNPGLKSRFDKIFYFEDHSTSELLMVCKEQFLRDGKELSNEALIIIEKYISHISEQRQKGFGNAREIRKIVNEILKNQKLRLARIKKEDRTSEMRSTIEINDVLEFKDVEVKYRKQIGYIN